MTCDLCKDPIKKGTSEVCGKCSDEVGACCWDEKVGLCVDCAEEAAARGDGDE